jgi:hypothetical protein
VTPSISNTADPNYNMNWDFCELTYNSTQIFANITFVDFVGLPISLTLINSSGIVTTVGGLPVNGLQTVANGLIAQNAIDNAGWNQLVINNSNGSVLRAISPLNGIILNSTLFQNYFTDYLNQVWQKYVSEDLIIDMKSSAFSTNGVTTITGFTSNDRTQIVFPALGQGFSKPSARDIFAADSGAFAAQVNNTAEMLNIGARIDAALNRSTLLINSNQPDGEVVNTYYQNPVTNHYSRIVHNTSIDGRGYAFPYDDVGGAGLDQSGFVSDSNPHILLINVGGGVAPATSKRRMNRSVPEQMHKRSLNWEQDDQATLTQNQDVERAERKLLNEFAHADQNDVDLEKGDPSTYLPAISFNGSKFKLPPMLDRFVTVCTLLPPNPSSSSLPSYSQPSSIENSKLTSLHHSRSAVCTPHQPVPALLPLTFSARPSVPGLPAGFRRAFLSPGHWTEELDG